MPETPTDPFAPTGTRPARLAARAGCTEGQLYSLLLGMLLVWVISANGLPSVAWEAGAPARPAATAVVDRPGDDASTPTVPDEVAAGPLDLPTVEPSTPLTTPDRFDAPVPLGNPPPAPETEPVPPSTDGARTTSPAPSPAEPRPTTVVSGGYASNEAGTPLATFGVPEGGVAVARRAGRTSKVTYLRLSGNGTPLVLDVDPDGANVLDAQAAIRLCPVLDDDWDAGPGDTSLDDAPTYDCERSIVGVRSTAGDQWTFDIAGLGLPEDAGVALVPDDDATTPEFQVVFRLPADDDTATEEER